MQAFGGGHSHSHGGLKKSEPSDRKNKTNEHVGRNMGQGIQEWTK